MAKLLCGLVSPKYLNQERHIASENSLERSISGTVTNVWFSKQGSNVQIFDLQKLVIIIIVKEYKLEKDK